MKKRVMLCAAAFSFALPQFAYAADASSAEMQLIQQAGKDWIAVPVKTVSPQVLQALSVEDNMPVVPRASEIVYDIPVNPPELAHTKGGALLYSWTERAKLSQGPGNTVRRDAWMCFDDASRILLFDNDLAATQAIKLNDDAYCRNFTIITDKTGLLVLFLSPIDDVTPNGIIVHAAAQTLKLAGLSLQPGDAAGLPFSSASFKNLYEYEGADPTATDPLKQYVEQTCQYALDSQQAKASCSITKQLISPALGKLQSEPPQAMSPKAHPWDRVSGLYLSNVVDLCFTAECWGNPHAVVDYKMDGEWHSKSVSAALPIADKQKANSLFGVGFDSFKGGDFTSAVALLKKGLEVDPANYLAYFTLGEVARSKHLKDPNDMWAVFTALYYYQRAFELSPPDRPEAIKSKAHLDAHSVD